MDEMKGCRAVQCLLLKKLSWEPEPGDQDFELDSRVFLTGIGNGSPDLAPLESLSPIRHVGTILSSAIVHTSGALAIICTRSHMLTQRL